MLPAVPQFGNNRDALQGRGWILCEGEFNVTSASGSIAVKGSNHAVMPLLRKELCLCCLQCRVASVLDAGI